MSDPAGSATRIIARESPSDSTRPTIYVYGLRQTTIEQISSGGTVTYLHHDQAGSTRLLTGSTGTVTGKCTYSAYGIPTCEGTTTTPLGYDAQYTSPDTGLIYMRARVYDPTTAQFLTVDPLVSVTRAPYNYAADNPVNERDRTGLEEEGYCVYPVGCVSGPGGGGGGSGGLEAVKEVVEKNWHEFEGGAERIGEAVGSIWNEVTGHGGTGQPVPPGYNPETWEKDHRREPKSLKKATGTQKAGSGIGIRIPTAIIRSFRKAIGTTNRASLGMPNGIGCRRARRVRS